MPCELVSWLKTKHVIQQTDHKILQKYSYDILESLGGIIGCLNIVLKTQYNITTSQSLTLTKCLKEINNKEEANKQEQQKDKPNPQTDSNEKNEEDTILKLEIFNIGTKCMQHITTFLTISEIATSFKNVCTTFSIIGIEQTRKVDFFYMNGHDLIIQNQTQLHKNKCINMVDFGNVSLLRQYRSFKDQTFQILFTKLSIITNIPLQYLVIWHYTKRKNGTIRPNRLIELNWNEKAILEKYDEMGYEITQEMKLTHTIWTYCDEKYVHSIHQKIGSVVLDKRMFILLDRRKIMYGSSNIPSNISKELCIGLKYFDVFSQTQYFVDWVYVTPEITFGDIIDYIENNLICNDKYYFKKCKKYLDGMKGYIGNNIEITKEEHLIIFEEEQPGTVSFCPSNWNLSNNNIVTFSGDIFIFQINPKHPYVETNPIMVEIAIHQTQQSVYQKADSFMLSLRGNA